MTWRTSTNCAIAMVAMVNHYYGGDLSQDRIGYEIFKDRQAGTRGGPELRVWADVR